MPDKLTGQNIKSLITEIITNPEQCGFEVFIITKTDPGLRKMRCRETGEDNLRQKLKDTVFTILNDKYNSDNAEYVSADRIADEQKKFYIISTSEEYDPLSILRTKPGTFSKKDIEDATGIAFSIRHGQNHIWAYQHLWAIMVPNKSKKNWIGRLVSNSEGDVFEELSDPIITFAKKIDMLIIGDNIIASDYKLLQNYFGFQDYIRIRAGKTIAAIEAKGLVTSTDKLKEYVKRGNGKVKYAKRMMRITDSKVLKMEPARLWENIHKSARWNGKLKEQDGKFVIQYFTDVEILIDLLDERYTRSDITGEEYDTDVKKLAGPVGDK